MKKVIYYERSSGRLKFVHVCPDGTEFEQLAGLGILVVDQFQPHEGFVVINGELTQPGSHDIETSADL